MGRGGDKAPVVGEKKAVDLAPAGPVKRWESLPTEVLRKKAKQFGHNDTLDREALLRELVSIVCVCLLRPAASRAIPFHHHHQNATSS